MEIRFKQKLLLPLVLCLGMAQTATAADKYVFGSYASPNATWNKAGILPWLERLKEISEGRLQIEFLGGGSAVTQKTGIFVLRDGLIDGTLVSSIYHPAELPVINLIANLGPLTPDPLATAAALTETFLFDCPTCVKEMDAWNIKFLAGWAVSTGQLLCAKPVKTLDDIAGLKIRAIGYQARAADAVGATPVSLTATEIYEGLQRGQIDCAFGGIGWLESFSLGEHAQYVTTTNTGMTIGGPLLDVRLDLWNALSTQQRQDFIASLAFGMSSAIYGYRQADEDALKVGAGKYEVMDPSPEMVAAIREIGSIEYENAIVAAQERGVTDAQDIADTFLSNYEKWEGIMATAAPGREGYETALQEHIFNRLSPE